MSRKPRLGFTCRSCGVHFVKRHVTNPRYCINRPAKCPNCKGNDTYGDAGNAVARMRMGYFHTVIRAERSEKRRQAGPKPTATPWHEVHAAYIQTPEWRKLRAQILERDGNKCRACPAVDGLHVHHVHYRTLGQEKGDELVTLCKRCHRLEHGSGPLAAREHIWQQHL